MQKFPLDVLFGSMLENNTWMLLAFGLRERPMVGSLGEFICQTFHISAAVRRGNPVKRADLWPQMFYCTCAALVRCWIRVIIYVIM